MKTIAYIAAVFIIGLSIDIPATAAEAPPPWAYGFTQPAPEGVRPAAPPPPPPVIADPTLHSLPDSSQKFTRGQIGDPFGPADWYPGDHPAMPDIVAKGRKPDVWACALCHYPNGKGRPENAAISGLSVQYFIEQMQHFRNGERNSADVRKANTHLMTNIARAMTDDEIRVAAEYYARIPFTPWIRVVETTQVPRTTVSLGLFLPVEGGATEPLGNRILEVPEDVHAVEFLRNPRVGFVAYAPPGSVARGRELVTNGGGKTIPCGICHGSELKGLGNVPAIAGRSPSYMVRQMFDMQAGTRQGPGTELMKPVVMSLTNEDLIAIAAYSATLQP